jgi:hypothetical protein
VIQDHPVTPLTDNDLPQRCRQSHARRRGWKCKEWADRWKESGVRSRESGVGSEESESCVSYDSRRRGDRLSTCDSRTPDSTSDEPELGTNLPKCAERLVEILSSVCRGNLTTNSCLTLGDHGIAEAGNEDPFLQ